MNCPHGEISPACCMDCLEAPLPLAKQTHHKKVDGVDHWMVAKFPGYCKNACGRYIDEGDLIRRLPNGGYGCEGCTH